ncbi:hypothetical protein WQ57_14165 [Mesobacillus campisalis]|uniref:Uncharacterized protein n=1 Tax=Mesobacillus campisalis TaxID=1408103 RepID=A0A0M2SUI4_9BACI|nr:hypothetical protein WQ57_14165 [Mesobacillus campisalis]
MLAQKRKREHREFALIGTVGIKVKWPLIDLDAPFETAGPLLGKLACRMQSGILNAVLKGVL